MKTMNFNNEFFEWMIRLKFDSFVVEKRGKKNSNKDDYDEYKK